MSSRNSYKIAKTGFKELDAELKAIADEDGPKSINKEMRTATRQAIRRIVLPRVRALVPYDTGFLHDELTVKSIRRSRVKMGTALGFKNDLFKGDTFYAGFHEFGWQIARGGMVVGVVPGDSFLRVPLYQNETKVKNYIAGRLRLYVRKRNK